MERAGDGEMGDGKGMDDTTPYFKTWIRLYVGTAVVSSL